VRIVDVSSWQSLDAYNLGDFDGLIAKATEGTGYVDKMCDKHYQKAKGAGKLRGVYHFARPDLNKGTDGARREAQFFVKNIQGYIKDAILVLDYEVAPYSDDWSFAFMEEVHNLTGVWPMLYASASKINGYNWQRTAANCGLWIAGYPAKYDVPYPPTPTTKDMPYKIGQWGYWCIWQYSSSAGRLDVNITTINAEQWGKYANPGGGPSPTPTPTPAPTPTDPFLPAKGYWGPGDNDKRVGQIAAFMRRNFPAYTSVKALGPYYGPYLKSSVLEFQKRTRMAKVDQDGCVGPKTLAKLRSYGFPY
jgi:hypothetical protein